MINQFGKHQFNQVSNRPQVYKQEMIGICQTCHPGKHYIPEKPWVGRHPNLGAKHFDTQREAFDYANTRLTMYNGPTIARQYGVTLL